MVWMSGGLGAHLSAFHRPCRHSSENLHHHIIGKKEFIGLRRRLIELREASETRLFYTSNIVTPKDVVTPSIVTPNIIAPKKKK